MVSALTERGRSRPELTYRIFLLYGGMKQADVCDRALREATERAIGECSLDHVVCLTLDPVYDEAGNRREDASHVWASNDYILDLRRTLGQGSVGRLHPSVGRAV